MDKIIWKRSIISDHTDDVYDIEVVMRGTKFWIDIICGEERLTIDPNDVSDIMSLLWTAVEFIGRKEVK